MKLSYTKKDMSLDEFKKKTKLMDAANNAFMRDYNDKSKPTLSAIPLSNEDVQALQDIFFDKDGSLRESCKHDVDNRTTNDPRYVCISASALSSTCC